MNQLTNLAPGSVPAHIAASQRLNLNAAAHANLASSFAVVGYKGKMWRMKYRGNDTILQTSPGIDHNGKRLPESPVPNLRVVVVGLAHAISKTYYEKRFAEGDDGGPDCFATNGISPDPASPKIQSQTCAACQWNKFGSRITDNGKKAKACQDSRRLAVVPAGDEDNEAYGGPMLLRIPPMSLLNLDRYCRQLDAVGADISQVITVLSFNLDVSFPEILFAADGWVDDPQAYATVLEHGRSELVRSMLSDQTVTRAADPAPAATTALQAAPRPAHMAQAAQPPAQEPVPPPPQPVHAPAQVPVQAAPPQPSPFTQAAQATQAPAPAPVQAQPAVVVQGAPPDMSKAIDDLLS